MTYRDVLHILFFITLFTKSCAITIPDWPKTNYREIGDINLGVLIPVHHYSTTDFCSPDVRDLGTLQRIEAISQAVKEINNRTDILSGLKLGFVMFDDCYKDVTALAQSLHFIQDENTGTCYEDGVNDTPCSNDSLVSFEVIGVLGSESSTTTIQSANLLTSFRIPMISYQATAASLNDRNKYANFQRTIPPDTIQANVIVQFLKSFNWSYVSVVYTEGQYGEEAFEALDKEATQYDVCFAKIYEIKNTWTRSQYQQMVYELAQEIHARIIVVLTPLKEAKLILEASEVMALDGRMTWIAGNAWLRSVEEIHGREYHVWGSFSVNFVSQNVHRFDKYFENLSPLSQKVNPWISHFWERYHNCTIDISKRDELRVCNGSERFTDLPDYSPEVTVSLVYDTVYSYAYALDQAVMSPNCPWLSTGLKITCLEALRPFLDNVSFEGETIPIKYTEEGYVARDFSIFNVQNGTDGYNLVEIGKWIKDTNKLNITNSDIQWAPYYGTKPVSLCSTPCGVGEEQVLQQKRCCWSCEPCEDNQITYLKNGITRCTTCNNGTWPDEETKTKCEPLVAVWLTWSDLLGIILVAASAVGLLVTVVTFTVYTINISNPLIKASSREFSYMLFLGVISSYSFVSVFILEPTDQVCYARLMGVSLNFTLLYAPLMTKTIRIYRIFEAGKKMIRKPIFVSSRSQGAIVIAIVMVHASMIVIWSYFDEPRADMIHPQPNILEAVCIFPFGGFIASLVYNILLLVISLFFAFKSRKLPDNYNESKFIGLCVYSTVVIWVAFIPAYYTVSDALLEVMFLVLAGIANATLILVFIILPKLYALYFVDKGDLHVTTKFKIRRGTMRSADESSQAVQNDVGNQFDGIENQAFEEPPDTKRSNISLSEKEVQINTDEVIEQIRINSCVQRKVSPVSMAEINPSYESTTVCSCDNSVSSSNEAYELMRSRYIHVQPAPKINLNQDDNEFTV